MNTLVLNSDNKFLRVVSGFRGVVMALSNKVDILAEYEKIMRSQYMEFKVPAVVVLKKWKNVKNKRDSFPPTKKNLLLRDRFLCQYCGAQLNYTNATKDHIIPESKGGKNTFENLVSCCKRCNSFKADKPLEQSGLKLLNEPRQLTNEEKILCILKKMKQKDRKVWMDCLEKYNISLW